MKAKNRITAAALAGVVLGALVMMVSGIATAWAQDSVRVRGTIERVDGSTYVIKARDGAELKVALTDNAQIAGVVKASLSDIKQGSFVGVTAMPKADGSQSALEVHIFPEAMRGTGEGHRDWDLRPESKMTNANVAEIKNMGDGRVMTVQYKGGEKQVLVTPRTSVVSYEPASRSDLKPGTGVFINNAERQADGTFTAPRVNVGLKGQIPPM